MHIREQPSDGLESLEVQEGWSHPGLCQGQLCKQGDFLDLLGPQFPPLNNGSKTTSVDFKLRGSRLCDLLATKTEYRECV